MEYDSIQYLVEATGSEPRGASRLDLPGNHVLDADWSRAAVIESGLSSFPLSDVFSLYVTAVPEVFVGARSLLALGTLAAFAMRPFRRPSSR